MKISHVHLFISFLIIFLFITSCKTKDEKVEHYISLADESENRNIYIDAGEFNDVIIGLQTKVIQKILELDNVETAKGIRVQCKIILNEIRPAQETMNRISCVKDQDNNFKNMAVKLFDFYERMIVKTTIF